MKIESRTCKGDQALAAEAGHCKNQRLAAMGVGPTQTSALHADRGSHCMVLGHWCTNIDNEAFVSINSKLDLHYKKCRRLLGGKQKRSGATTNRTCD